MTLFASWCLHHSKPFFLPFSMSLRCVTFHHYFVKPNFQLFQVPFQYTKIHTFILSHNSSQSPSRWRGLRLWNTDAISSVIQPLC